MPFSRADAIETLDEGFQVIGFDWRYLYLNEAAARQGKRDRKELVGRTLMECYPGIETTDLFRDIKKCLEERVLVSRDNEFTYPDGTAAWFALRIHPVVEGALILSVDLSDSRRAAIEEYQTAALFRGLLHHTLDGVVVTDTRSNVTLVNNQLAHLLGYTHDEMKGMSMLDVLPKEDHDTINERLDLRRKGVAGRFDQRYLHKDGGEIWASVSASPLFNSDGSFYGSLGIITDITAQRRSEAAIARYEEQLRQAQKMEAIGRLAGGVAHDFNNVLSVILSYATMLEQSLHASPDLSGDVKEIRLAALRAADLVAQLLAFSRQQVTQPKVLDVNAMISGMKPMLSRLVGENIELLVEQGPMLGKVKIDPGQLEQVVMNLVINARDAITGHGKIQVETANVDLDEQYVRSHHGAKAGPHVMIAVSDNGAGMEASVKEKIFDPFFTTKALGKGTGLGLSTVFGIVTQAGGNIWLYSEPGKGATFKVYLQRCDEVPASAAGAPKSSALERGSETVLLVEDEPQLRAVTRLILLRHGYHVIAASDGVEALELAKAFRGKIDLVLTDVVMPRMGGAELADKAWAIWPDLKVLFMSGYTENAIVHNHVLDEGIEFLPKPITPDLLLKKLREVLDK